MTGVQMRQRPMLALLLGWMLVVGAVATVTFIVVDRAGRGVGQASAASSLPSATSIETSPTPGPTPTNGSTGTHPTTPATPTSPGTSTRTESFSTQGGTVVVSCDSNQVTLESITVRDGWGFEQEAERGRLEVKFEAREDDDVDDAELHIACVDGAPTSVSD